MRSVVNYDISCTRRAGQIRGRVIGILVLHNTTPFGCYLGDTMRLRVDALCRNTGRRVIKPNYPQDFAIIRHLAESFKQRYLTVSSSS